MRTALHHTTETVMQCKKGSDAHSRCRNRLQCIAPVRDHWPLDWRLRCGDAGPSVPASLRDTKGMAERGRQNKCHLNELMTCYDVLQPCLSILIALFPDIKRNVAYRRHTVSYTMSLDTDVLLSPFTISDLYGLWTGNFIAACKLPEF